MLESHFTIMKDITEMLRLFSFQRIYLNCKGTVQDSYDRKMSSIINGSR